MTRPPRIPLLLAIFVMAIVLRPIASHACSCTYDRTVMEEFDSATAVFAGTVISIEVAEDGYNLVATLTPTMRWKGGIDDPVQVLTPMNAATCGFHFLVGMPYLVFASSSGTQPPLFTHSCSKTGLLTGNPTVAELPPPVQPVPTHTKTWGALKTSYR